MKFKDIEEAVLAALNITSKLKDPELTTAMQSILDKCVAYREEQNLEAPGVLSRNKPPLQIDNMDSPEVNSLLGELTPDNTEGLYTEEDMQKHFEVPRAGSPEHLALIEKQNPGTLEKWVSNKMKEDAERMKKHFGEQQAEGLDNLLEGLRDTPHDNRW